MNRWFVSGFQATGLYSTCNILHWLVETRLFNFTDVKIIYIYIYTFRIMIFGQGTDYNLQLFADHDFAVMVTDGSQITASISHQQQWLAGSGKLTFPIIGVKTRFFQWCLCFFVVQSFKNDQVLMDVRPLNCCMSNNIISPTVCLFGRSSIWCHVLPARPGCFELKQLPPRPSPR